MSASEEQEQRMNQLKELDKFLSDAEGDCMSTLTLMGWTKDGVGQQHRSKEHPVGPKSVTDTNQMQEYYLLPTQKKLELYAQTSQSMASDEQLASFGVADIVVAKQKQNTFTDINKLKRDLKRRRMKYRTTKAPPLTYSEELRELIQLQMEMLEKKD